MGCWNGTCGISQLPILYGEKIRVLILMPSHGTNAFVTSPNNFVYSDNMFDLLGVPFVAEYNDYGTVENIVEDYNTKIIHDVLARKAVLPKNKPFAIGDEVTTKDDKYLEIVDIQEDMISVIQRITADPETKIIPIADVRQYNREGYYDDFGDLENIINLIERNVFEVDNSIWMQFGYGRTAIPGLFYVRENVWQAMIADIENENLEYRHGYKSRETLMKQIDEFLMDLKKPVEMAKTGTKDERAFAFFRLQDAFETIGGKENKINGMFGRYGHGFNASIYKKMLIELVGSDDIETAKKILSDIVDTNRFMDSMSYLRKPLIPQCGQGSQCIGEDYHEALNKIVATEIDSIKHHWDEED